MTKRARAREVGVKSVPALVCGDSKLVTSMMTKAKIREFLSDL